MTLKNNIIYYELRTKIKYYVIIPLFSQILGNRHIPTFGTFQQSFLVLNDIMTLEESMEKIDDIKKQFEKERNLLLDEINKKIEKKKKLMYRDDPVNEYLK